MRIASLTLSMMFLVFLTSCSLFGGGYTYVPAPVALRGVSQAALLVGTAGSGKSLIPSRAAVLGGLDAIDGNGDSLHLSFVDAAGNSLNLTPMRIFKPAPGYLLIDTVGPMSSWGQWNVDLRTNLMLVDISTEKIYSLAPNSVSDWVDANIASKSQFEGTVALGTANGISTLNGIEQPGPPDYFVDSNNRLYFVTRAMLDSSGTDRVMQAGTQLTMADLTLKTQSAIFAPAIWTTSHTTNGTWVYDKYKSVNIGGLFVMPDGTVFYSISITDNTGTNGIILGGANSVNLDYVKPAGGSVALAKSKPAVYSAAFSYVSSDAKVYFAGGAVYNTGGTSTFSISQQFSDGTDAKVVDISETAPAGGTGVQMQHLQIGSEHWVLTANNNLMLIDSGTGPQQDASPVDLTPLLSASVSVTTTWSYNQAFVSGKYIGVYNNTNSVILVDSTSKVATQVSIPADKIATGMSADSKHFYIAAFDPLTLTSGMYKIDSADATLGAFEVSSVLGTTSGSSVALIALN